MMLLYNKGQVHDICLLQCPAQLQRTLHFSFALKYLHKPHQVFLQPQCSSSLQAVLASGRVVHLGIQLFCVSSQPQSEGEGSCC